MTQMLGETTITRLFGVDPKVSSHNSKRESDLQRTSLHAMAPTVAHATALVDADLATCPSRPVLSAKRTREGYELSLTIGEEEQTLYVGLEYDDQRRDFSLDMYRRLLYELAPSALDNWPVCPEATHSHRLEVDDRPFGEGWYCRILGRKLVSLGALADLQDPDWPHNGSSEP